MSDQEKADFIARKMVEFQMQMETLARRHVELESEVTRLNAQLAEARELLETAIPNDNQVFIAYDGWLARRDACLKKAGSK